MREREVQFGQYEREVPLEQYVRGSGLVRAVRERKLPDVSMRVNAMKA
jgi:hypothetical protein